MKVENPVNDNFNQVLATYPILTKTEFDNHSYNAANENKYAEPVNAMHHF